MFANPEAISTVGDASSTVDIQQKPRTIGILGIAPTSGNRGVQALGAALMLKALGNKRDKNSVLLFSGQNSAKPVNVRTENGCLSIPVINNRMSLRAPLRSHFAFILLMSVLYRIIPEARFRSFIKKKVPWIRHIAETDCIGDIRGGDSFSDIYGLQRFIRGFLTAYSVILVKGTIIQFPQTYGPFKTGLSRILAKVLFSRSSVVVARDNQSLKLAREYVSDSTQLLTCPDIAFSLVPIKPQVLPLIYQGSKPDSGLELLGINVSGLLYYGGYSRNNMFDLKLEYRKVVPELICTLLKLFQGHIVLIPHTLAPKGSVESDNSACADIYNSLGVEAKKRVHLIDGDYDCHELKWIIGQTNFFIGARMHSCIAALSQGVPCIGIAYSSKFYGVFQSVSFEDWVVDARVLTSQQLIDKIILLFQKRDKVRIMLAQEAEKARNRIDEVFSELFTIPG